MLGALRKLARSTSEAEMLKKCTRLWREAHFEAEHGKAPHVGTTFWTLKRFFIWQAQWILYPANSKKNVRVL